VGLTVRVVTTIGKLESITAIAKGLHPKRCYQSKRKRRQPAKTFHRAEVVAAKAVPAIAAIKRENAWATNSSTLNVAIRRRQDVVSKMNREVA
jgi:hypothetical protein